MDAASPKKRPQHYLYDTIDEPAELLQQEAVDIEEEIPAERIASRSNGPTGKTYCPRL